MPTNGYVDRIALNQLMKRMDDVSSLVNSATRNAHNGGPYTLPQLGIRSRGGFGATDKRKDIDAECGYPLTEELDLEMYQKFFDRLPEGKKAVTLLPKETWKVHPKLVEGDGSKDDTPFLKAWDEVCTHLGQMGKSYHKKQEGSKLWSYLRRFDELSGLGHYGVLLIGLNDKADKLEDPVEGIDPDTGEYEPGDKALKDRKILFLQPFSEANAEVVASETDDKSPRFGAPTYYDLNFEESVTGGTNLTTKRVHWSRVIHFADNTDGNDYIGVPRMRPCFNQLINLYLLYGCSAEMFWNGAFPPTYFSSHPQLGGDVVIDKAAFKGQMEKLMSGLQRWAILMGLQPQQLQQVMADPTPQITLNRKAISLILDIPDRIFEGSERGELSSAQDSDEWEGRLMGRRVDVATPDVLHPVTDRFIAYGVLPKPSDEGYAYEWPEKDNMSKLEKAQANLSIMQTLQAYVAGNVETILERKRMLMKFADMTEEEAEENMEDTTEYEEEVAAEEEEMMKAQQDQALALAKVGGKAPPAGKPPFGAKPAVKGGKPAGNPFAKNAQTDNVFCPTGEGGGVDPSCSPEGSSGPTPTSERTDYSLVSKHVQDSATLSSEEREQLKEVVVGSRTSRSRLERVSSDDPKHEEGSIIDLGPTSFTSTRLTRGEGADHISIKYSDEAVYVVRDPTRGLDVDYSRVRTTHFTAVGERETILAGRYRVAGRKKMEHPASSGNIRVYILEEVN